MAEARRETSTAPMSPASMVTLIGMVTLALIVSAGVFVVTDQSIVIALGSLLLLGAITYVMLKPTYVRAIHLMIITLPMVSGFVIDVGGNMRVPYYFAALALLMGAYQMRLRFPNITLSLLVLAIFMGYAVISIAMGFTSDTNRDVIGFGFRTSIFRPLIQVAQLALMGSFVYLVINYVNSRERLVNISRMLLVSLGLATIYGAYEVICAVMDIQFLNINTNPDYIENRFAGTQTILAGDVTIHRPRSMLTEPTPFAAFMISVFPLALVSWMFIRNRFAWLLTTLILILTPILFVLTWSRAAFVAMVVVWVFALVVLPTWKSKRRLLLITVVIYLLGLSIVYPLFGTKASFMGPLRLVSERISEVVHVPLSLVHAGTNVQIGRDYGAPINVFKSKPLTGVGLGNYASAYATLNNRPLEAVAIPSLILEILAQLGIIGTMLFILFIILLFGRLIKSIYAHKDCYIRSFSLAILFGVVGLVVMGFGAIAGLTTNHFLWVLFGLAIAIPQLPCECAVGRWSRV